MSAPRSLSQFAEQLRRLPRSVATMIAAAAAPEITALGQATFNAGQDPYGNAWLPGIDGHVVTLEKTGAMKAHLQYVAIGTKIRVALGMPYAKYQIGKRPVFPTQGGGLPDAYRETLARVAVRVVREELGR